MKNKKQHYMSKVLIECIDFLMYSVPRTIYEEVRTTLLMRGLICLNNHTSEQSIARIYVILRNLKITEMRKYYAKKREIERNHNSYDDEFTIPIFTDAQLDRIDSEKMLIEYMEILYTAYQRMRPVQRKLVRAFFRIYVLKKNEPTFEFETKQVVESNKTGVNKRRGFLLLREIRVLIDQVIKDRKNKKFIIKRVKTFTELRKFIGREQNVL